MDNQQIRVLGLDEVEAVSGGMQAEMHVGSTTIVVASDGHQHCVGVVGPHESVTTCHF